MIQRLRNLLGEVSFHRGLALGALVGSAIAGSTIWSRLRQARERAALMAVDDQDSPERPGPDTAQTETPPR